MKSVQIDQFTENFADIQLREVAKPEPGPGQVRVRMLLAAVNPSDLNAVRGNYYLALKSLLWNRDKEWPSFDPDHQRPCPKPPYALGGEGVGIVEACGSGWLARRLMGKRVAISAGPPNGAWQEYTVVDARRAVPVPASVSDSTAAMYFVNPLSAYAMVCDVLKVKPGGWLIQDAAGSALAKIVIRLSKVYGFKTINVVRSASHRDALLALGADLVVATDSQDLATEVARATANRGADYALDCVGGDLCGALMQCLSLGGHMVLYGTLSEQNASFHPRQLMMRYARITGFFAGAWVASKNPLQLFWALRELSKLAAQGVFDSPVAAEYSLEQVQEAVVASQAAGRPGKVLLRIGQH